MIATLNIDKKRPRSLVRPAYFGWTKYLLTAAFLLAGIASSYGADWWVFNGKKRQHVLVDGETKISKQSRRCVLAINRSVTNEAPNAILVEIGAGGTTNLAYVKMSPEPESGRKSVMALVVTGAIDTVVAMGPYTHQGQLNHASLRGASVGYQAYALESLKANRKLISHMNAEPDSEGALREFATYLAKTSKKPDSTMEIMNLLRDNFVLIYQGIGKDDEPEITSKYRVELTWGRDPIDLDAWFKTSNGRRVNHLYRGNLNAFPYAWLREDIVDGFGPEIIYINALTSGTNSFYVEHLDDQPDLSGSQARVVLKDTDGAVLLDREIPEKSGRYWHVFDFIGENIVIRDKVTNVMP